jgi:hypothetical protein
MAVYAYTRVSTGRQADEGESLTICQEASCGHSGSINVDSLPDSFPVPDVSLRLLVKRVQCR